MQIARVAAVFCVVTVLLAADVWAQGRGRGRGGSSRMWLLGIEKVQNELDLSDDQTKSIQEMRDAARANRGQRQRGQQLTDEERQKLNEEREKQAAEQRVQLAKILSEDQAKRLTGIYIQVAGTSALRDPMVSEKLGLTEEQSTKIQEASDNIRAKMRELFQSGDREQARAKLAELRKQGEDDAMAVLTDDQKTMLTEMKGKPFELPPGAMRGGRGGGRGGARPGAADRPDRPAA